MKLSAIFKLIPTLALALGFLPGAAAAATHMVTVQDNSFSPKTLTIQAGDTVQWNNAAGGNTHNITSNNGTFGHSNGSSFTYSFTFNSAGSNPYQCTIHGGMTGTITVEAVASGFVINSGLNDAWGDPAVDKQGFFIIVFPDIKKLFLSWFTYDTQRPPNGVTAILGEPGHRWLTAFGGYTGDTATLNIELTQGGIFDANPPDPTQSPYGTIELLFNNCNQADLSYNIPSLGLSSATTITRTYASPDNVALCESLQTP